MTRWVQMVISVSGYRHDDRRWPKLGGVIDVPDWEAEDLIRGGNAVPAEAPDPEPEPEVPAPPPAPEPAIAPTPVVPPQVSPLAQASPVAEVSGPPQPPPEPEVTAGPPRPADAKQAWIDWAVSQGADVHAATAMSKADLMSRWGGRL